MARNGSVPAVRAYPGLAAALAASLAARAPAGLELREEPAGHLCAAADEHRWESFPVDEPELEEELEPTTYDPPYPAFGVLEALDFVQEFVRNELGEEWGGEPWAELEGSTVRFGLGSVEFPPVSV
jgi:hypothetical protein